MVVSWDEIRGRGEMRQGGGGGGVVRKRTTSRGIFSRQRTTLRARANLTLRPTCCREGKSLSRRRAASQPTNQPRLNNLYENFQKGSVPRVRFLSISRGGIEATTPTPTRLRNFQIITFEMCLAVFPNFISTCRFYPPSSISYFLFFFFLQIIIYQQKRERKKKKNEHILFAYLEIK